MKMNKYQAFRLLKESGMDVKLSRKPRKPKAKTHLLAFYEELKAVLDQLGFNISTANFEEFTDELNGMGSTHLFNVANDDEYMKWEEEHGTDDGYSDHYLGIAEDLCKKINSALRPKFWGFEADCDVDDTQVMVTLTVDGMGDL